MMGLLKYLLLSGHYHLLKQGQFGKTLGSNHKLSTQLLHNLHYFIS